MTVLENAYVWIKALHIISVIAWMAGLLYLPRLFVYHVSAAPGGELDLTLKTMEARLYVWIMRPAMLATLVFGVLLIPATGGEVMRHGWLHAKLFLVILLLGVHHMMGAWRRAFAEGRNKKTARFFRFANEIPTVIMVLIVFLVVVQPF
jgi:putative membrane protein